MVKKRWQVEYIDMVYDGGGCSSWSQFYRTKLGARLSRFLHLYIRSWGGKANLYKLKDDPYGY